MISIALHVWWGITYRFELLSIAMFVLILSLISSFMAFRTAYHAFLDEEIEKPVLIPLSLYTAWLLATTVSRMTIWFIYIQTNGGALGEINLSRMLIFVLLVTGIVLSYRYWNFIFTLVVAWLMFGIYLAQKDSSPPILFAAFFCGVIAILWSILVIFIKKNPRTDVQIR
jgi:hypothetical protein